MKIKKLGNSFHNTGNAFKCKYTCHYKDKTEKITDAWLVYIDENYETYDGMCHIDATVEWVGEYRDGIVNPVLVGYSRRSTISFEMDEEEYKKVSYDYHGEEKCALTMLFETMPNCQLEMVSDFSK